MKKIEVIWTNEAIQDLETIHDFLESKSIPAAQRTLTDILNRAKQLENFPESGPVLKLPGRQIEYRYLVEGNYRIIYSVRDALYIEVVYDTRQNPANLPL